jgi:hypothetical protein
MICESRKAELLAKWSSAFLFELHQRQESDSSVHEKRKKKFLSTQGEKGAFCLTTLLAKQFLNKRGIHVITNAVNIGMELSSAAHGFHQR